MRRQYLPGVDGHVNDRTRTTRLGQVIQVPGSRMVDEELDQSQLQLVHSLVMADESDLDDDTPWVLAIACNIIKGFVESEEEQWVVPLLAEITMGAGGASHTFLIDAWPYATIQLPAGAVKVIIKWDLDRATGLIKSYPETEAGEDQFVTPEQVQVTGTLVRGFSASNAHRSFLIQTNADAPLDTGFVEIPDFAQQGFYWFDPNDAAFAALAGELAYYEFFFGAPAGFALSSYTIAQLVALKNIGKLTPVPANAGFWKLNLTAPDPTPLAPSRVSFPIRL